MSGFARDWLALREPADRRARHDFFAAPVAPLDPRTTAEIIDLGCGTGANFRYLLPRLAAVQHWICVDHDARLLEAFAESLATGPAPDHAVPPHDELPGPARLEAQAPGRRAALELRRLDLAAGIAAVELPPGALVTASALLDLVSEPWLESVAAHCARAGARVLFALTYDGRIACSPSDPFDAALCERINRHQRRDKGFGPALGPAAAARGPAIFTAAGYDVATAQSDWLLGSEEADLQRELIAGWLDAAREIGATPELERWQARRLAEIDARRLTIRVGHSDLLGLPRPRDVPS